MGYIPAIFVILGACFLWGLVVFNSLKSRRALLKQTIGSFKREAEERNRVLQAILNELTPIQLSDFDLQSGSFIFSIQYKEEGSFYNTEIKAQNWLKQLKDQLVKNKAIGGESLSLFMDVNEKASREFKRYKNALKEYNNLVRKKPTSYIAYLFNFKVVPVDI